MCKKQRDYERTRNVIECEGERETLREKEREKERMSL